MKLIVTALLFAIAFTATEARAGSASSVCYGDVRVYPYYQNGIYHAGGDLPVPTSYGSSYIQCGSLSVTNCRSIALGQARNARAADASNKGIVYFGAPGVVTSGYCSTSNN